MQGICVHDRCEGLEGEGNNRKIRLGSCSFCVPVEDPNKQKLGKYIGNGFASFAISSIASSSVPAETMTARTFALTFSWKLKTRF